MDNFDTEREQKPVQNFMIFVDNGIRIGQSYLQLQHAQEDYNLVENAARWANDARPNALHCHLGNVALEYWNMQKLNLLTTAVAAALLALTATASVVKAATVQIGLSLNGGAISTVATGVGATGVVNLPFGTFTSNSITASGRPTSPLPDLLGSTALDVSSATGGTLRVYVTSTGNTDVNSTWLSTFTSNALPAGWRVTEQTYLNTNNQPFATQTLLGSAVFNNIGTSVASFVAPSGALYGLTEVYTILATGAGQALSTINIQTPIPPALALFAGGLIGLGWLTKKRKKNAAATPVAA